MNIYLVQHGNPVSKEENPERPLSKRGREDVEKMADFLKKTGVDAEEVWHSTKARARETAEIIISKLNPEKQPLEKKGLSPLDDVHLIAQDIEQTKKDFMIVGHLPNLAKLTSFLTTGSESNLVVKFQQGGVVCLQSKEEKKGWMIAWMLLPEMIFP